MSILKRFKHIAIFSNLNHNSISIVSYYTNQNLFIQNTEKFPHRCRFYSTNASESDETSKTGETENEKKERVFFKEQQEVDGFKVFDVYMNKKKKEFERGPRRAFVKNEVDAYARYNKMSPDQDWTNVWPTSSIFKQNAVPFPVRMGYIKNKSENDGLPPVKYANTELMKIPNFLHLSPPHIKKHCNAIKKFCTPWPKELKTDEDCEKYFPIEITTSNYIYDGPSIRDDRARVVTLQIKVSSLNLDERSNDKFIKLAEHRYDPKTDILTIVTDSCPYRRQNIDYANYLLTTLYFESQQVEDWEEEMTEEDQRNYKWEKTKSKTNILNYLCKIEQLKNNANKQQEDNQASSSSSSSTLNENEFINLDSVKNYKKNISKLFDEGESKQNINSYKDSVLGLLKLNNKSTTTGAATTSSQDSK